MLARGAILFKWTLYALAALLCVFVQTAVAQRIELFGTIVFLYPLIAVIPATYEGARGGTVFALCVGVFCDLLLPSPIPCFYTLIFPVAALCASALAENFNSAGFLCSLVSGAAAYLLTGLFHALILALQGHGALWACLSVTARELLISLPWSVPMTLLYRAAYRRAHRYD